ncbi:MAG: hypothetical protein PHR22_00645 [Candidatus Omnitrophica bacterium]|nr:hypothetical protein [Candidatus Omnitrophota bacterium]
MNPKMLEESKTVAYMSAVYKRARSIADNLTKNSMTTVLLSSVKRSFLDNAVKSASILVFTAIAANIILDLALRREMGFLDIVIKGTVLLLSLGGFFSGTTWQEIKKSSFILSKILKWPKKN